MPNDRKARKDQQPKNVVLSRRHVVVIHEKTKKMSQWAIYWVNMTAKE